MKNVQAVLILSLAMLLGGCISPGYTVGVSAFSAAAQTAGSTFWIVPGDQGVSDQDFEFREYAGHVRYGLQKVGFVEALSADAADLTLRISYGIGDRQEHAFSYSMPVYGQSGGTTYNYTGTTYSGGGISNTHGTVYQQPQFGVVGSQAVSGVDVTYLRFLRVEAVATESHGDTNRSSVWRTDAVSRGTSSDLRRVFPVLVVAAAPFFGRDTRGQVVVDIPEDDERLADITRRQ